MEPIKVVCGIIWKDGKVLIAKRKPEKSLGGYWEFPGGKLENNEAPELALIRELKEEMDLEVSNLKYYDTHLHQYDNFSIELIAYECDFANSTFNLTDHDEVVFVSSEKLAENKIAPADVFFVNKLVKGQR